MIQNVDKLHENLEREGESSVRIGLAKGVYGEDKKPIVREWLHQKEQFRADQHASAVLKNAKHANLAAWVSTCAAIVSILANFGSRHT